MLPTSSSSSPANEATSPSCDAWPTWAAPPPPTSSSSSPASEGTSPSCDAWPIWGTPRPRTSSASSSPSEGDTTPLALRPQGHELGEQVPYAGVDVVDDPS